MLKVLVTDKLAQEGLDLLANFDDVEVTVKTGISEDELASIIGEYDGLIIRSGTQVTAKVLQNSGKLRGIARAGVGVDNIDVATATKKGIVVMNTPDGNTISAAEHSIALLMAISRHIVPACNSLKQGRWDRKLFMGTQLIGKTLGIVGLGRIGMAVARRAQGLKMKIIAYDPIVSQKTAEEAGIEYVSEMKEVFARSDYITLHVPVTDQTKGMVNAELISIMKPNAVIINVARGAVINDDDLYAALEQKKIAGAALDVFAEEPPANRGFEKLDNCLVTPHLGASTSEAQVVVAVDAAQELVEALRGTQMRNALNAPGLDKTLPDIVKQYCSLSERLGMVISTLAPGTIKKVEVTYRGEIASHDTSAVTTSFSVGLLQNHFEEPTNVVNVHLLAKQCGLSCDEIKNPDSRDFASTIAVRVVTDQVDRKVTGTIVGKKIQRVIAIDDYNLEVTPEGTILIAFYDDKPGVIGSIGTICGKHNINIGTMGVGRLKDKAVLAVSLDEIPTDEIIAEFKKQVSVQSAFVCQLPTGN